MLGDFAGGGLLLAMGVASALVERHGSGLGQVIDVAMVDGAAMILGPFFVAADHGVWGPRGTNHLDGGAPFYNVYETADGRWLAVGAIEPQFYLEFATRLGVLDDEVLRPDRQNDRSVWPAAKQRLREIIVTRTRDEWCAVFEGSDSCVAPVLAPTEVADHPHTATRGTTVRVNGVLQAQSAPRFSRTNGEAGVPNHPGSHDVDVILADWR
jgi:alpha-methylacyl-CoA racemase